MVTTTANILQPLNDSFVTLSGTIKSDAQFSVQPVAGDQIIWHDSSGLNISETLSVTGPTGAYDVWHIRASDGTAFYNSYTVGTGAIVTDTINLTPVSGQEVVTLTTSIATDAQFTVQPVSGDQIIYPNTITVDQSLVFTGSAGSYTVYHIVASTGQTYVINYTISGAFASTVNLAPGINYTLATLNSGFDPYVFQQWGVSPVAGEQIITLTSDGYFDNDGNYFTNTEHVHDAWHIALDGTATHFTVDSTGIGVTEDTTPDAFTFTDVTTANLNTAIESNTITVTGVTAGVDIAISVSGGEYAVDTGSGFGGYTSAATSVQLNHQVKLRQTSSASNATTTDCTLTIGGVSDTWSVTTESVDITPDQFTLNTVTSVPLSTVVESTEITVLGISAASPISVVNGQYAVNTGAGFGAWQTSAGTVSLNDIVKVRHTSSASYETNTQTDLTIGGVSSSFITTTEVQVIDSTPDAFTFTDVTGQALSTAIESNAITVLGVTAATNIPISVSGGEYAVSTDGGTTYGAFTSASSNVQLNYLVKVRQTSSNLGSTQTDCTLTIGGVSDVFSVTTLDVDVTPAPFELNSITNVPLSTVVESNEITVLDITAATPIPITVVNGEYAVNGGSWTTAAGTVVLNDVVKVRHASSVNYESLNQTNLSINGVSSAFRSTTLALEIDVTPDAFTFTDLIDQTTSSVVESTAIQITGMTPEQDVPVSISGGEYSISRDGGITYTAFTANTTTIVNGNYIRLRQTTSDSFNTRATATLTIGSVSSSWNVTTTTETIEQFNIVDPKATIDRSSGYSFTVKVPKSFNNWTRFCIYNEGLAMSLANATDFKLLLTARDGTEYSITRSINPNYFYVRQEVGCIDIMLGMIDAPEDFYHMDLIYYDDFHSQGAYLTQYRTMILELV